LEVADEEREPSLVRCDLHVHSLRSGAVDLPVLNRLGNECYSEPRAVYAQARRRGMDLVTLTDHDTIEGALEIASLPGTFVSEEVTCELPGDRRIHLGVWDISEAQHRRIATLRHDAEGLFAFLAEERVPFCVNHLFSALTGKRELRDFHVALGSAPLLEARNGMMSSLVNSYATQAGTEIGMPAVGGSDAHTLASVARAYTVVEGASTREEFLEGLRVGRTIPAGTSGSYARLTADVARVFAGGYLDNARHSLAGAGAGARMAVMLAAIPLLPLMPLVTAAIYLHERAFATRHWHEFQAAALRPSRRPERPGPWGAAPRPAVQP
jgi:predicted metal-dependent phosphoesterase TrpH